MVLRRTLFLLLVGSSFPPADLRQGALIADALSAAADTWALSVLRANASTAEFFGASASEIEVPTG